MKKILALLLAAVMCLSLVACGGIGGKTEVVELTLDNWQDYFELTVVEYYDLNAFGEVEKLELQQHLCVKEEYADHVDCENVAFEIQPTLQTVQITLNTADQSYTSGEVIEEFMDDSPEIVELFNYASKGFKRHGYGDIIYSAYIKPNGNDKFTYVPTLEQLGVIRVTGTITIKK